MSAVFEKEYDLRTSDFDCYGNILPGAVLDIFQDAAGRHSKILKVSVDEIGNKNLIWVLLKVRFKVFGKPLMYSRVTVKTWPLPPSKATLRRDYIISDEEGNVLIKGESQWAVVHRTKRRIMPALGIYSIPEEEFCTENALEGKMQKIHDFVPDGEGSLICPGYCDIDVNRHVNNTKYANFVVDALSPENEEIEMFQIDYHREVLKGCNIRIHTKQQEEEITAMGKNINGDTMFSCRIKYKQ